MSYDFWIRIPDLAGSMEDKRLLGHVKLSWLESDSVYYYRKVTDDMCDLGKTSGKIAFVD
jgi:putative transposase